jgi:hypothetical protein
MVNHKKLWFFLLDKEETTVLLVAIVLLKKNPTKQLSPLCPTKKTTIFYDSPL